MRNIQLSENFWLHEFTKSQTAERYGIDNFPKEQFIIDNLKSVCVHLLQPLRYAYDMPIRISSGYRCLELNRKIGSKDTSQHVLGYAVDFEVPGVPNLEIAEFISENMDYDQCILEYWTGGNTGWIHCSYVNEVSNRYQDLTINKNGTFYGFKID